MENHELFTITQQGAPIINSGYVVEQSENIVWNTNKIIKQS